MKASEKFWLFAMFANPEAVGMAGLILFVVFFGVLSIIELFTIYVAVPALIVFLVYRLVRHILAKRKLSVVHAPSLAAARVEIPQPQLLLEEHKGPQRW